MSTFPSHSPLDDPFPGASKVFKRELSKLLETFISTFEHEGHNKQTMSHQLHLHARTLVERAKELGGHAAQYTQNLVQAATDFANGHGKIETVYKHLEALRDVLSY